MIQNVGFESEDAKTRHCLKAEGMCTYSVLRNGGPQWCRTCKIDETYILFEENLMVICQFLVCLKLFEQSALTNSDHPRSQEMQKSKRLLS